MTQRELLQTLTDIYKEEFDKAASETDGNNAILKFVKGITQATGFSLGSIASIVNGSDQDKRDFLDRCLNRLKILAYSAFEA